MGCSDIGDFDGSGEIRIRANEFEKKKKQQQPTLGVRIKPSDSSPYFDVLAFSCIVSHFQWQAEED